MGLVNIEKNKETSNTNDNAMNRLAKMNNLNNINDKFSYRETGNVDNSGMYKGRLKTEESPTIVCLTTITSLVIFFSFIALAIFLTLHFTGYKIQFFPELDTYSVDQYKNGVIQCLIMLSGLLLFACIFVKVSINISIKSRLKKKYLKKVGIYIYDVFIVLINILIYILLAVLFFILVTKISNNIISISDEGRIYGDVNLNLVDLFKWAVVVLIAIFGVLNCFKGIKINHNKNRFVLEDTFDN